GADLPFGLASAVGPVPFAEPADAVEFARRTQPRFPTVPVLLGPASSLLAQAVDGVAGVTVDPDDPDRLIATGALPSPRDAAESAAGLDGAPFEALREFCRSYAEPGLMSDSAQVVTAADVDVRTAVDVAVDVDRAVLRGAAATAVISGAATARPAAVRIPVLGPVTLALALRAAGHDAEEVDLVAASLVAARSVALARFVRTHMSQAGDPVLAVVMSEPGLVGSMHPTFRLLPAAVRSLLDPVVDALDRSTSSDSLLIGVHVPGPCDWPTVIGSGASLLCVPVDRSIAGWAPLFGDLLDRGGRICWGAVRVDRPMGTSTDPHWRSLVALWTSLVVEGVDPMALRLRSTFSPAGGLEAFDPAQAQTILEITEGVAERVGHQALAARLSLGA
nr:hypothetical protein [Microthrixaceae bacterium]